MERDDFSNDPKCRFQMFFDFVSDAMRVPSLAKAKEHIQWTVQGRVACGKPALRTIFVFDHKRAQWMQASRTDEGLELEYCPDPTTHPLCDKEPTTEAYWIHSVGEGAFLAMLGNPWTAEGVKQDWFDVRREAIEYCLHHGGGLPLYMVSTRTGAMRVWRVMESDTMGNAKQG